MAKLHHLVLPCTMPTGVQTNKQTNKAFWLFSQFNTDLESESVEKHVRGSVCQLPELSAMMDVKMFAIGLDERELV